MMAVWTSIKDPTYLGIRPTREESKRALEEMMPLEDITMGVPLYKQPNRRSH